MFQEYFINKLKKECFTMTETKNLTANIVKEVTWKFCDENFDKNDFLTKKVVDMWEMVKQELLNNGWDEKNVNKKSDSISEIIYQKQFQFAIQEIYDTLKKIGTKINIDEYDGIIVKKLQSSDKPDTANQSHIFIPKDQWGIFPYLESGAYLDNYKLDASLKSFFSLQIPITISKSNLAYLKDMKDSTIENEKLESFTSVRRGKGSNRNQLEFGHSTISGDFFNEFNCWLHKDYFLIILKIKNELKYEAYGIKPDDVGLLKDLDKKFCYSKLVTLITSDIFDLNRVSGGENILLYGVPGSGKSRIIEKEFCDDESRMERVIFHQDYTYSDFVGHILPKINDDEKVIYKFVPGPFTSILREAVINPTEKYFLIIEEINRGNAPAIFGDVFQLLDRVTDENNAYPIGTSEYSITNPDIAWNVYKNRYKKVRIPSNLSIIATMNTSDQNVFTLDTAFQRRWDMRLIQNNFDDATDEFKEATILDTNITWEKFCTKINKLILKNNMFTNSSEDKRLGTYFVNLNDLKYNENEEDKEYLKNRKFPEKVLKYLWDDAFKFDRKVIFKTNEFNSLELIIKEFNSKKQNERFNIFHPDVLNELEIDYTFESNSDKDDQ